MSRRTTIARAAAVCLAALLGANSASALEIEEVQWGFDGQVVQHRFNLLSVLVSNPTAEAFDGGMELEKSGFVGGPTVGAALRQPVFLSPFSKKWVQFHPFTKDDGAEWRLQWGAGNNPRYWGRKKEERYEVNEPRFGPPALVILNQPGELLHRGKGTGLKGMAEGLFPPIVTATDGLKGVVLDHSPRWQQPRRQAFLDWLHRGGEVHILRADDGEFPTFPAPLADLNAPLPVQHLGQGLVFRHERTRQEMTSEFVKQNITNRGEQPRDGDEIIEVEYGAQMQNADTNSFIGWEFEDGILQTLKGMTLPDHNWFVIYAMSFVYLLLIFPGGYLLGRQRIDYRMMIGALLGTIALFSVGFSIVGARGYDETTTVNTLAIAHPLPGGFYDVAGWSNAFVTEGDDYLIAHPGQGRLYSTCQSREGVAGVISENPADRFFEVDIPPFSSRPFAHRVKAAGRPLNIQVEAFTAGTVLEAFTITCAPELQNSFKQGYVLYGNQCYRLRAIDGRLVADARGQNVNSFLNLRNEPFYNANGTAWGVNRREVRTSDDDIFAANLVSLITRSLNLNDAAQIRKFRLPADRARLFLFATLPTEFQIQSQALGQQAGGVLYCVDAFKQP